MEKLEPKAAESPLTEESEIRLEEISFPKRSKVKEVVVVVTKKGQTTIPVKLRRKYQIEEGTKLEVIDTGDGVLLKRKKTFWDMAGAYAGQATVEEVKAELDKMRHEVDPDDEQSSL